MARVRRFLGKVAPAASVVGLLAVALIVLPSSMVAGGGSTHPPLASAALPAASGPRYPVVFAESGLPLGTNWTVSMGGAAQSSTGRTIVFYEINGTYPYTVHPTAAYLPTGTGGNITVQGGNDTVIGTISVPGSKPWGGATDPATGNVFMAYDQNGNLSVINGSTNRNAGNFGIGKSPDRPIFDPIDGDFYVPNWGSNNLTVFDPVNDVRVANVTVGQAPIDGVFDPANGLVYVVNDGGNSVSVLNGSTAGTVTTIPVGMTPYGAAYDPLTHEVYVTNYNSNNVSVISGTPGRAASSIPLPANSGPFGIAYDGANGKLYVTQQGSAACPGGAGGTCYGALINGSTNAYLGTFVEGKSAAYPSFDPVNDLLYIAASTNPGTITVISPANSSVVGTIPVGKNPETIVTDAPSGMLYSADYGGNTITIINGNFYLTSVQFVPRPPTYYSVNFTESGLPAGTNWTVSVNGTGGVSPGATISFSELNGSYPFTVGSVPGFRSTPSAGDVAVNGTNVTIPVVFRPPPPPTYSITFLESGLATGTSWTLTLNGTSVMSSGPSLEFDETNGSYSFQVSPVRGFTDAPSSGTVVVAGKGSSVSIAFTVIPPAEFSVGFRETGLPNGTTWSVTVGSATMSGAAPTLWVNETNGSYAYTVAAISGFSAAPSSGVVTVTGTSEILAIHFNATSSGGGSGGGSGSGGSKSSSKGSGSDLLGSIGLPWLLLVMAAAVAAIVLTLAVLRRRKKQGSGTSMAMIAASAGMPPPISQVAGNATGPSAPAEPTSVFPPASLPPPSPPPKPTWSEE
jgi:YVTN family beta-propeller protein